MENKVSLQTDKTKSQTLFLDVLCGCYESFTDIEHRYWATDTEGELRLILGKFYVRQ